MRSVARVVIAMALIAAGQALSACSSSSLDSFDPSEWFETKKKLTGDRKPVFPDGVPGVQSGVPAELVKGFREPEGGMPDPAKTAAAEAAGSDTQPKKPQQASKPKPKPKPATASATPRQTSQQQPPPPAQSAGGAWPSPQQPAPWPGNR
jgi:hypothetical protein